MAAVGRPVQRAGYAASAPGWPGDADTVEGTRANADAVAELGVDEVAEHYAKLIVDLPAKPILVGHSFGGLLVEKLLGDGHGVAGVAIDARRSRACCRCRSRRCGWRSSR